MFCFFSEIETSFLLFIVVLFIKDKKKKKLDIVQETREINCETMDYYSAAKRKQLLINATM